MEYKKSGRGYISFKNKIDVIPQEKNSFSLSFQTKFGVVNQKQERGFTLIELLGVIVVLAVLALIITPSILSAIESSRKATFEQSVHGLLDAVLKEQVSESVNKLTYQLPLSDSTFFLEKNQTDRFQGVVSVNEDGETIVSVDDGRYCAYKGYHSALTIKKSGECYSIVTLSEATTKLLDESSEGTYSYLNGTYLKGAQNNNYIWFSGVLWRIMGKNADGTIRLMAAYSLGSIRNHAFRQALNYDTQFLNSWLNDYFYPQLKEKDQVVEQQWCLLKTAGVDETLERTHSSSTCEDGTFLSKRPVGLVTLDEFNLSNPETTYLYADNNGGTLLTMSIYDPTQMWLINEYNKNAIITYSRNLSALHPVINIDGGRYIIAGDGTKNSEFVFDPIYVRNKGISEAVGIGEYVIFSGRTYRVLENTPDGVQLLSEEEYKDSSGRALKFPYGTIDEATRKLKDISLDRVLQSSELNQWVLQNSIDREKLVTDYVWYHGNSDPDDYRLSIEDRGRPLQSMIGLMKKYQVIPNLKNKTGWTLSLGKNNDQENEYGICASAYSGVFHGGSVSGEYSIMPVIVVQNGVKILSGSGTRVDPYQI